MTNIQHQYDLQRLQEENRKLKNEQNHVVRDFIIAGIVLVGICGLGMISLAHAAPAYENKELAPKTFSVTCYENVERKGKVVCVSAEADLLKNAEFFKMGNS